MTDTEEFESEETRDIEKSLKEGEPVEIIRQPKNRKLEIAVEDSTD